MDIGTGLALFGSAELATKILGPTADYIGEGIKNFSEKRINNVKSIFQKAFSKIEKLNDEQVLNGASPYLIKTIFDYGSYSEDELIQDYLAGLLVSSRTCSPDDNRSAALGMLVQNLTTYQIRTHYLFYSIINRLYCGKNLNLGNQKIRGDIQTYVSLTLFDNYVFKTSHDKEQAPYLYEHIMHGLNRHTLIENSFAFGSAEHLSSFGPPVVQKPGVIFQPSILGIELFLWISSITNKSYSNTIISNEIIIPDLIGIDLNNETFPLPYSNCV